MIQYGAKKGSKVLCNRDYLYQFTKGKTYVLREDYLFGDWYVKVEADDRGHPNAWGSQFFDPAEGVINQIQGKFIEPLVDRAAGVINEINEPKCTCPWDSVYRDGCKCGAMELERKNKRS